MSDKTYTDLDGFVHGLASLGRDEQELIQRLKDFAATKPSWWDYGNRYMRELAKFGEDRGLTREETTQTTAWRIAQDLSGRIGIAAGFVSPSDYRSELEALIHTKFRSRHNFCEATGLSEDTVSQLLSKQPKLPVDTLANALAKIGYTIHFAPLPEVK